MTERGSIQSAYKCEENYDQEHPALNGYRISFGHDDGEVCNARRKGRWMKAFRVTWGDTV